MFKYTLNYTFNKIPRQYPIVHFFQHQLISLNIHSQSHTILLKRCLLRTHSLTQPVRQVNFIAPTATVYVISMLFQRQPS